MPAIFVCSGKDAHAGFQGAAVVLCKNVRVGLNALREASSARGGQVPFRGSHSNPRRPSRAPSLIACFLPLPMGPFLFPLGDRTRCRGIARQTGTDPLGTRFAGLMQLKAVIPVRFEQNPATTVHNEQDFPVRPDISLHFAQESPSAGVELENFCIRPAG